MQGIVKPEPLDYAARKSVLKKLKKEYPFIEIFSIGQSCGGREIQAVRLGNGRQKILYCAAFHSLEHLTANLLLLFLENLCNALASGGDAAGLNIRRSLIDKQIVVVPAVNPDGIEIFMHGAAACGELSGKISRLCGGNFKCWNANLRGVDLNHNFDAGWQALSKAEKSAGIYGPCPKQFGGYHPFSEPETLALSELCFKEQFRHAAAIHSQGEEIYYKFGNTDIPRAEKMADIMAAVSGYKISSPSGLAVGGGFKDWFISEFYRPAFTIEVGKGENPLPETLLNDIYNRICEMLVLLIIM